MLAENAGEGRLLSDESVISRIMKECGIENATVIFKGRDYVISVLKIDRDGMDIEIKNVAKPVRIDDKIQLVLTVNGKRYMVSLLVSVLKIEDGRLIIKTKIVGKVNLDLRGRFEEIYQALKFIDHRRFVRLRLDGGDSESFPVEQQFKIIFPRREYTAFIKDISGGGVNCITTDNFKNEKETECALSVNFRNPAENITLSGKVVRKEEIEVGRSAFCEAAITVSENMHLNKRVMHYIKNRENGGLALGIG